MIQTTSTVFLSIWLVHSLHDVPQNDQQGFFKQAESIRIQDHKQVQKDKAAALYAKGCLQKHGASCWRYGRILLHNPNIAKQLPKSSPQTPTRLFRRSCSLKYGNGCFAFAKQLSKGSGVQKNLSNTKLFFQKACKYQSGRACYQLYKAMKNGVSSKKIKKNLDLTKQKIGSFAKKTFTYLIKGCQQNVEEDCYLLGHLHYQGQFGKKNPKQALSSFQSACKLNHPDSCDYLALIHSDPKGANNVSLAHRFHKKACLLGSMDGCVHLGGLYFRGLGGKKNLFGAKILYRQSCEKNHALGCLLVGEMMLRAEGGPRQIKRGFTMYKKACKLKQKEACKRVKAFEESLNTKK